MAGIVMRSNRSALDLLALPEDGVLGRPLIAVMPELGPALVAQAAERPDRMTQGQVEILQRGARQILLVRISAATGAGFVVTFDDVTDLMSAQRMAAWGDVARHIAHEIKNPLTPIQLSAEAAEAALSEADKGRPRSLLWMLHRHDRPAGRRHRAHGRRVLVLRPHAAADGEGGGCEGDVPAGAFPATNGDPGIRYTANLPGHPVPLNCDRRQVSQVLTNILKNSAEAIEGRDEENRTRLCHRARSR